MRQRIWISSTLVWVSSTLFRQKDDCREDKTPEEETAKHIEEVDVYVFVGEDQLSRCSFKGRGRHVVWPVHDRAWWGTDSSGRNSPPLWLGNLTRHQPILLYKIMDNCEISPLASIASCANWGLSIGSESNNLGCPSKTSIGHQYHYALYSYMQSIEMVKNDYVDTACWSDDLSMSYVYLRYDFPILISIFDISCLLYNLIFHIKYQYQYEPNACCMLIEVISCTIWSFQF